METKNKLVRHQVKYLELLKKNNLLELAMDGKLPQRIEKAVRQAVTLDPEFKGCRTNDDRTMIYGTAEEHEEAEKEMEQFLRHYKLVRDIHIVARPPRQFMKGTIYTVRSGYFAGRCVRLKGTDEEVFGCSWIETVGNPACENFPFRAQQDGIDVSKGLIFVCDLQGENRYVLLHEKEIGQEVH